MEIVAADACTTRTGRNYVLVKIETADGLVGYGDATLNGREKAVEVALTEHILPELIGRNARRIEDIWQMLFRQTYWRDGPVLNSALSGVDMALWDLKGKDAGVPVYDLLGGRTREYATVYQHCGGPSPEEIAERVSDQRDRGITHFRVNVSSGDQYTEPSKLVDSTRAVRELVGPEPELLVDLHGLADPIEAADIARGLEDVDLFFLEDPVRPENPDAFGVIRQHSTTPIAMGEVFTSPWQMLPLIERDLVDFVRTALIHVGGITAARKLAAIAEQHYIRTAFQGPIDISPVGYAATVHVDVAIPNFGVQELTEHEDAYGDPIADVFSGGHEFVTGKGGVNVPDEPGLGVDVDWDAACQYAEKYERQHMGHPRAADGSVLDI